MICQRCGIGEATIVVRHKDQYSEQALEVCSMCATIALLGPGVEMVSEVSGTSQTRIPMGNDELWRAKQARREALELAIRLLARDVSPSDYQTRALLLLVQAVLYAAEATP